MEVNLVDFFATDGVFNNGYLVKSGSKKIVIATHGMSSCCFKGREKQIAKSLKEIGADFFVYNNRGSELVKYVRKFENGIETKFLGGTSYEDPREGVFDIEGAIKFALNLGYEEIYLQGHSLGSTKVVYTYNKLKNESSEYMKYIKGIILLSLVDVPRLFKVYLQDKFNENVEYAKNKIDNGLGYELMPKDSFIHPISAKTFYLYTTDFRDFDFAKYSVEGYNFEYLNNIDVPLFMRWGNKNELVEQDLNDLTKNLNNKIKNEYKNIDYIDGADHGYSKKEEILSNQIVEFLQNI